MSRFVHLHTHSHFSLLEALPKVEDFVAHVKALEQPAVALTDNGSLYGAIEFYETCKEEGIKPIFGMDAYVAPLGRHLKRAKIDTKPNRLVLLAETLEGYQNLIALSSDGFLEGFYYKPRIDKEVLRLHTKGLIALSGGYMGDVNEAIKNGHPDEAKRLALEYQEIFGVGNFYLELVDRPEIAEQETVNAKLIEIGKELGIPVVATKNTFFIKPTDAEAWKILQCIKGGKTLEEFERVQQFDFDASMVSSAYMEERFKDVPEAIENTAKIADRCNVELTLGKWNFADYKIPEGKTFRDVLTERVHAELPSKVKEVTDEMRTRIAYELDVIDQKGFCPYFLIVSDYIEWARRNGVVTTTRGSAAGSLVGFSIGISAVDPMIYKLPFERFLNPERPSAPDIDADFADNRRDEVLAYVTDKYGKDKVAQICTFGTMLARGSVRDVGRALGETYGFVDEIAKLIPMGSQGFPMTLERALEETPDLKRRYDTEASVRRLIDLARQIEGCARHVSIHAAGVVISPSALTDFTPLQIDTKEGKTITQYEMKSVEAAGLVKMDFLGIRNLSILGDAVKLVKQTKGIDIDIERVPVDDAKTFELLAKGHTMGTFQLNGEGMTKYLMELAPTRIEDIMAMVALYRPGPIESIPEYIRRKHDPRLIAYLDPRMKDIVDKSFGVIVYQDDVMLIAIKLAGYSWLEADKLRKAMGKKIPEEMAKQKEKLLLGFVKHGMSSTKANELWKLIEPFAAYGFNKCLSGDTRVMDPKDGSYRTMKELFDVGRVGSIVALQDDWRLRSERRVHVVENGVKQLRELATRSGRRIRATDNHPFRRLDGWKRLDELKPGDRIATPRRLPAGPGTKLNRKAIRALGLLIAEGNLCHPHGVYYYSKSDEEVQDFIGCLKVFPGTKATADRSKPATAVYVGQTKGGKGNSLRQWLEELGLLGKKATEKELPEIVFRMNKDELSELVAGMWQGDGCVHEDENGQIFYATSSEILARQLQHVLLRIGICSTVHEKKFKYRGGLKYGFTIHVSGKDQLEQFQKTVGGRLLPNKRKPLERIVARIKAVYDAHDGIIARGTKDIVPASLLSMVREKLTGSGTTLVSIAERSGLAIRSFTYDPRRIGYSRPVIERMAEHLDFGALHDLATSDVYWDEIVSITPAGREMTYDLEVPKSHNFVANDIVVHNSHACSYGMVAYETAYMKSNFPAEYMTALMTAESADLEKIAEAVAECRRMGIDVLPPDINESNATFTYKDDKTIRFGLVAIKNLGEEVIQTIIAEREANGPFPDLTDFAGRIQHRAFNKKSLEALAKTGALDRYGERSVLLENMERILLYNKSAQKEKEQNQGSLFDSAPSVMSSKIALKQVPPASQRERLSWEKELLGLYVSGHPFIDVAAALGPLVEPITTALTKPDGTFVRVAGMIITIKQIVTKKGDDMAFVGLEDGTGKGEMIVFPRTFAEFKDVILPDTIIVLSAKVNKRDEETSLIANSLLVVEDGAGPDVAEMLRSGMWIAGKTEGREADKAPGPVGKHESTVGLAASGPSGLTPTAILHKGSLSIALHGKPTPEMVDRLREILKASPGTERVCLMVEAGGQVRRIETDYLVTVTDAIVNEIAAVVGRQNVKREVVQAAPF